MEWVGWLGWLGMTRVTGMPGMTCMTRMTGITCEQVLWGALKWRGDEKKKESLQLSLWNLNNYLHRKSRCEMLIGGDDISYDFITLGTCFSMFVYIRACFRFALMAEIWQLSQQGATVELEAEFKFQRHSCKLSFLFPPHRQSAPESLLAG